MAFDSGIPFGPGGITTRDLATMTTRRKLVGAAAMTGGWLALGGPGGRTMAQDDAPIRGGVARVACFGAVTSLDPHTSLLGSGDRVCNAGLYETLVSMSIDGAFEPELATDWNISDDGLTYTFTIRENVPFHDGSTLDAAAVKFNFDRYRGEGSTYPGASSLAVIDTVEAPDDRTVVITLAAPSAPFLTVVAFAPVVSPAAVEALGEEFQLQGSGTGPFRFREWTPGSKAVLERFDGYWQTAPDGEPYPYLDAIEVDGVADDSVRLLNLRSGEFEYVDRLSIRDVQTASLDSSIQVYPAIGGTGYRLAMNPHQAPFDNQTLRQAVQAAVDRQAIIDNIGFGQGYLSPAGFAADTWFFLEEPSPVFDPELARSLLAEAGYPDGLEVSFTVINRPVDTQIAQIVADNLGDIGIRANIEVLERTAWVDLWSNRQGELGVLISGGGATDPGFQAVTFDPNAVPNWAGYDSAPIIELVAAQDQTTDQEERRRIWEEITAIMIDDAVYVQIGIVPAYGAAVASARDFQVHPEFYLQLDAAWSAA